jgi:hypothetical protein
MTTSKTLKTLSLCFQRLFLSLVAVSLPHDLMLCSYVEAIGGRSQARSGEGQGQGTPCGRSRLHTTSFHQNSELTFRGRHTFTRQSPFLALRSFDVVHLANLVTDKFGQLVAHVGPSIAPRCSHSLLPLQRTQYTIRPNSYNVGKLLGPPDLVLSQISEILPNSQALENAIGQLPLHSLLQRSGHPSIGLVLLSV